MDFILEEKMIKRFFVKERAERFLFELKSKKKRRTCIWRINSDTVKENHCHAVSCKMSSSKQLTKFLIDNGADNICYVMSIDESIDGKNLPLAEAVNEIYGRGTALLFFENAQMGYLECEYESGYAERYLLK